MPQFSCLQNGDNNSIYLTGLLLGVKKNIYIYKVLSTVPGWYLMWTFVTIIISHITFSCFWNIHPLPFSSPINQAVSFCVLADQPNGRWHSGRTGQASGSEDQRTPWMKVHWGPAVLQSPVSAGSHGWHIGTSLPPTSTQKTVTTLTEGCPCEAQTSSGTTQTCSFSSSFFCSRPSDMGDSQKILAAGKGPLLRLLLWLDVAKGLRPLAGLVPPAPHLRSLLFK